MATVEPISPEYESEDRKLRKTLTFQDLFFLSMGGIIGSGWLLAALGASAIAGPAVILSWVIGGILVLLIALTYAEVAGMLPRSGAIVRYPHLTHGSYAGFFLGWAYLLAAASVPTIEAEAVVTYASKYIHGLAFASTVNGSSVTVLTGLGILFGAALTVLFFFLNYFGIKLMGRFNTVITWWKFVLPVLTFIFLFFLFNGSNFSAYGGFTPLGIAPIFKAIPLAGIVFSYLGFRQALDFGGEARNPQRDVPRATIFSVVAGMILYTLLQVAFTGAMNWTSIGGKAGNWAGLTSSHWASAPFASALGAAGIGLFGAFTILLFADAYISPGGTGMVYAGTSSRTIYGLAMDGYFPTIFRRVSQSTGVPIGALVAALVLMLIFLLPLPSWYLLVGLISSATVLTYIMGGVGLMVLRRTAGGLHRPFYLQGAQILAPIAFIAAAFIVYWSGTGTLNYIVTAVVIGLPLYAWFYAPLKMGANRAASIIGGFVMLIAVLVLTYFGPLWTNSMSFYAFYVILLLETVLFSLFMWFISTPENRHQITAAAWFIVFLFGLYLLTYIGPFSTLPTPIINFGWDELIVAVFALIMFYWAVASGYSTPEIQSIVAAANGGDTMETSSGPAPAV
jgi:amino acid transporter